MTLKEAAEMAKAHMAQIDARRAEANEREAAENACHECAEKDQRIEELGHKLEEATKRIGALEAEVADLLPAAQRGNTWIYKSGPENLRWLKAIAEITNEKEEGFYSGQRVLRRVEELAADRDGLLALVLELSTRLDEMD